MSKEAHTHTHRSRTCFRYNLYQQSIDTVVAAVLTVPAQTFFIFPNFLTPSESPRFTMPYKRKRRLLQPPDHAHSLHSYVHIRIQNLCIGFEGKHNKPFLLTLVNLLCGRKDKEGKYPHITYISSSKSSYKQFLKDVRTLTFFQTLLRIQFARFSFECENRWVKKKKAFCKANKYICVTVESRA